MWCNTILYKNKEDFKNDAELIDNSIWFLFRVFDYQSEVIDSFEKAEKFILEIYNSGNNLKPRIKSTKYSLTYSAQMSWKILFANKQDSDCYENLTNYKETIKRLKEFYKKYPEWIISFW